MSGMLSSFLDNAPTYLAFFNMSLGNLGIAPQKSMPCSQVRLITRCSANL